MKKFNLLGCVCLLAFAFLMFVVPTTQAQSKSVIKAVKKEAKQEAKRLKKENWELVGIGSLEGVITDALMKIRVEGYISYPITLTDQAKALDAQKVARANAMNAYASEVAGEIESVLTTMTDGIPQAAVEQIKDNLTLYSKIGINGQLREAYTLLRKVGSKYEVQTNFLLNPNDDYEVKIRALQQAISIANLNAEVSEALIKQVESQAKKKKAESAVAE